MATDARGHTVPDGASAPHRGDLLDLSLSVRDIVYVGNVTARASAATALGASATNPVYTHRADAGAGRELEVTTDGVNWNTIPATPATPYAWSAGTVSGFSAGSMAAGSSINAAVTFPVGRFSQPPKVNVSLSTGPGGSVYLVPRALNATATGFSVYLYNLGSSTAVFSGLSVDWTAVQMTSASAAG